MTKLSNRLAYVMKFRPNAWMILAMLGLLSACGGGGSNSSSDSGSYLAITGVKNVVGNPVVTVCLNNVADATADNARGEALAANLARFYFITGNYSITSSNYQNCSTLPGAIKVSVDYYNNTILPWVLANPASSGSNANGNPPVPGTNNTPGTNSGGGSSSAPNGSSIAYISWNGSSNGSGIRDFGGNVFGARASDGQVYHWPGNSVENKLSGLTVTGANLYSSSGKIGYVGLADASDGSKVAVFYCTDGGRMNIAVTSTGWYHECQTSPGAPTPGTPGSDGGNTNVSSLYGAISYGTDYAGNQAVGISYNGANQTAADVLANQKCDEKSASITCGVVLNISGRGACGALAWNDKGWGASATAGLGAAQLSAISSCVAKTGATCKVAISACNDN